MRVSIRLVPPERLPDRTALEQLGQRIGQSLDETAAFLRQFADSLERGVELWDDEEELEARR